MSSEAQNRRRAWILFALLLVAAGAVRFTDLGLSPFRADTINFYQHALNHDRPLDLWKNPPWPEHIPLAETIMLWFHQALDIQPTHFSVRFPFALMGTLTMIGLFFFVRRAFDWPTALAALLLAAINPFHVHFSREAYYYVGVTMTASFTLWAFWRVWVPLSEGRIPRARDWIFWFLAGLLQCHTHLSAWMPFGAQWLLLAISAVRRFRKDPNKLFKLGLLLAGIALVLSIVLFPVVRRMISAYLPKAEAKYPYRPGQWLVIVRTILDLVPAFSYGTWWPGWVLLGLTVAAGVWYMRRPEAPREAMRRLGLYTGVGLLISIAVIAVIGKGRAGFQYFSAFWPCFMAFFAVCLRGAVVFASERLRLPPRLAAVLVPGLVAAYFITPVCDIVHLEGKPKPYKKIVAWCDANLPPGTPVLVDRWYEPWNELRIYHSRNAIFTWTVPDEPLETFMKNHWRETAKAFLETNPDAAYLEIRKTNWDKPGIGPWHWPRKFFKRHAVLKNEPGLRLQRWGLNFRPGGKIFKEGLIVEFFYNTREDVMEKARLEGRKLLYDFGPGWGCRKLGLQDPNNWRELQASAELQVINLTDHKLNATIALEGVALKGNKKVQVGSAVSHLFKQAQLERWVIGTTPVRPGVNALRLSDPLWSLAPNPLFVRRILLSEAPAAPPPAKGAAP